MTAFDADIPKRIEYSYIAAPIRANDYLPGASLSVEHALDMLPQNDRKSYKALYQWFIDNTGTIGPRYLGKRLAGVNFAHVAQRGIHAPAGTDYAVSITVKQNSFYSDVDGQFCDLGDKTWVLNYSAHRNNVNNAQDPTWNQKLINCLTDGIPVGVFVQQSKSSNSYYRALAFVEEYNPSTDVFVLHGPVTPETEHIFELNDSKNPHLSNDQQDPSVEDLEKDNREFSTAKRVVRRGQSQFRSSLLDAYGSSCAITGYGVEPVLQAAHILEYHGTPSNSIKNGIILRADFHILFDRSLIGIDPCDYRVSIGKQLADSPYAEFDGKQIFLPKSKSKWPKEEYIAASFAKYSQGQKTI